MTSHMNGYTPVADIVPPGLEADRVFVLNRDAMPSSWAKQEWEKQQERNLIYVAFTRARQTLVFISKKG